LVNNLSMAACLTSDQPLPLQDRDLVALVGQLCEKASSPAAQLNLNLRFVCAMERHICAVAPEALEQILGHLLSNAFKFTPAGGSVTVELKRISGRVLISVEDTGPGIPEEILATLFDRYLHSDRPAPHPHGLGLGLPLCRRLAEGHGGTLMAESRPGKGSRFTLSLPDQQKGTKVSDIAVDYSGGFNQTLLNLADALPVEAFLIRNQD
jgi:signal transduction histidine kinase